MANPTVPSNFPKQQAASSATASSAPPIPSDGAPVRIKTEPSYEGYQQHPIAQNYPNPLAQQRAAAALQQKFGATAAQQISQLNAQAAMGTPPVQTQRGPMNIQLPSPMSDQQRLEQAEFKRRQQAQQYRDLQQAQQRPLSNGPQTDGADDWKDYVARRRLEALENPAQALELDSTIRQQVELMSRSMEGGGLMLPLAEQSKLPQAKKRKVIGIEPGSSTGHSASIVAQSSNTRYAPRMPQLDGVEDDDEEDSKEGIKDELFGDEDDEDAINSDLDDPDDNIIEEEQEEGRPAQIMLCTYDKVARVKNKWKCTLKDGVLTTGGKE